MLHYYFCFGGSKGGNHKRFSLEFSPFCKPLSLSPAESQVPSAKSLFFYLRVFEAHLNTYLFGEFDNSEQYKKTRMNIVVYFIFTVEFSDSGNNYIPPLRMKRGVSLYLSNSGLNA